LSKRFAEQVAWPVELELLAVGALALTLAACGSSTPRQAGVDAPRETAVPVARADEGMDARGRATQARAWMPEVEQRRSSCREQLPMPRPAFRI
jgi:hypothetical protein